MTQPSEAGERVGAYMVVFQRDATLRDRWQMWLTLSRFAVRHGGKNRWRFLRRALRNVTGRDCQAAWYQRVVPTQSGPEMDR